MKNFTKFNTPSIFIIFFFLVFNSKAQNQISIPGAVSQLTLDEAGRIKCEIHAHDEVAQAHHQAYGNSSLINKNKDKNERNKKKKSNEGATILVDFYLFDPEFQDMEAAQEAFQSAIEIWSKTINSDQPIHVAAVFQPLRSGLLGSAGPTWFVSEGPGLERETWYNIALAEKLTGMDIVPEDYDIIANFSTAFSNWYFGTDANPPADGFDFRSVVIHELCHGLGFIGSMFADNDTGMGAWGLGIQDPIFPSIYDRFVVDSPGKLLINKYENFSTELGDILLNDPLYFHGNNTLKATNGKGARLFTVSMGETEEFGFPDNFWVPGASYSHLDYFTFAGTENEIMTPFLSLGNAFDDLGPVTKAIFNDMGWNGKIIKPFNERAHSTSTVDKEFFKPSLNLYPNHVQDQFVLELGSEIARLLEIKIVDMLGHSYTVSYSKIGSQLFAFDLSSSNMDPGIYILQLIFENQQTETLRISKIR